MSGLFVLVANLAAGMCHEILAAITDYPWRLLLCGIACLLICPLAVLLVICCAALSSFFLLFGVANWLHPDVPAEYLAAHPWRNTLACIVVIAIGLFSAFVLYDVKGARVIVQGFGNVGSWAAKLMHESGYKIVGVADVHGALYNENGLDAAKLMEWVHTDRKPLPEFPQGGTKMSNTDILFQPCDILLPAATENQLTSKNAHKVQAKILCEGANGPTTAAADEILEGKGVFVIPDILANAGGVTVSYFEWVQNRQEYYWSRKEVIEKLDERMTTAYRQVADRARDKKVSLRQAAYETAIERVVQVTLERGVQ